MTDGQIIELFRQRSENAVDETEKKYGRLFYSVAYNIVRSHEDAEECVNDTFMRLWQSIPPADPTDLGAYGCRIARNAALNRVKAAGAEKRAHAAEVTDELLDSIPSNDSDLGDAAALSASITRFLSSERPERRIMFVRRYFYMDKTREIAKLLHVPEATVRMSLHRMKKRFAAFLKKEGYII